MSEIISWLKNELELAKEYPFAAVLLFNDYLLHKHQFISGFSNNEKRIITHANELNKISHFNEKALGILSYDLKNSFEHLPVPKESTIAFPELFFFEPQITHRFFPTELEFPIPKNISNVNNPFSEWQPFIDKYVYLDNIYCIKRDITEGTYYELNYCIPFKRFDSIANPYAAFYNLYTNTYAPFSIFLKFKNLYLLCASPERFLLKNGNNIHSFPIKGTAPRGSTSIIDKQIISELKNSEKNKAENTMIVDLVRNDFSRISKPGSVIVPRLHEVHTFSHLHQMISQITSELYPNISLYEILKATFPMGSMTGAPKIKSMEYIHHYELLSRGWFSGAAGYIEPDGNFDLNVVIRSILVDTIKNYTLGFAGGAITSDSDPLEEWEEVQVKASAFCSI